MEMPENGAVVKVRVEGISRGLYIYTLPIQPATEHAQGQPSHLL
jgi:hypothetical protein